MDHISLALSLLKDIITTTGPLSGMLIGMSFVALESIFPVLPLAVFIAVNMLLFGYGVGFFISWIGTILGCCISFWIFRKGMHKVFYKVCYKFDVMEQFMNRISSMSFPNLVFITALPFTPAFSINIAAGLSNMSYKKFICAIVLAKLMVVFFWGFIGTTFLQSMSDIRVLVKLTLILIGTYFVSIIIKKQFAIE